MNGDIDLERQQYEYENAQPTTPEEWAEYEKQKAALMYNADQ